MPIANQTSTRFRDEIRSISPWAYAIAAFGFVAFQFLFLILAAKEHDAPALPVRILLGVIAGVLVACYILLVGYINQDSGRRGMSRLLWTLIAIFVPNGLGIVLYFVLRKPRPMCCPQCNATLEPGFSFCPRCRYHVTPVCPRCQRSVNPGDKFCPYCGEALDASKPAPAVPSQPA
jgi:RNA polymerase subunit RPABC4/transcription elongation factor Spt4